MTRGRPGFLRASVLSWLLHAASGFRQSVVIDAEDRGVARSFPGDCGNHEKRARWLREVIEVDTEAVRRSAETDVAGSGLPEHSAGGVETSASASRASPRGKVAFLFLVGSELVQPEIWTEYLRNADPDLYGIYVHVGQSNVASPSVIEGLPGAHMVDTVPNHWCALFGVEVALLRAALRDEAVQQLVFLPHDVVPLTSFDRAYAELMRDPGESTFCMRQTQRRDHARNCGFSNSWGDASVPKHSQWVTLSRAHAQLLSQHALPALSAFGKLALPKNEEVCRRDACSDEIAPLAGVLLGLTGRADFAALREPGVRNACRTMAHWHDCAPDELDLSSGSARQGVIAGPSFHHPATFKLVTAEYVQRLQQLGFLFARKVERDSLATPAGNGSATEGPPQGGLPLSRVLPQLWASFDSDNIGPAEDVD